MICVLNVQKMLSFLRKLYIKIDFFEQLFDALRNDFKCMIKLNISLTFKSISFTALA